jgi:hypothetical protein
MPMRRTFSCANAAPESTVEKPSARMAARVMDVDVMTILPSMPGVGSRGSREG